MAQQYVRLLVIFCTVCLWAVCSCENPTPTPTPAPTPTISKIDLLTAHPWFLTSQIQTYAGSSGNTQDIFIPNCIKDNTLTFKKNQSATYSPESISCGFNEASRDISWSLANNETTLLLTDFPAQYPGVTPSQFQLKILSLTANVLQLRYTVTTATATVQNDYTYSITGDFTPPTANRQRVFNRLTSHRWRVTSQLWYTSDPPRYLDEYAQMPACRRDDFLQFNPDYTVVNDEGASRCSPADPQTHMTNWRLDEFGNLALLDYRALGIDIPAINGNWGYLTVTDSTISIYWGQFTAGHGASRTIDYTAF